MKITAIVKEMRSPITRPLRKLSMIFGEGTKQAAIIATPTAATVKLSFKQLTKYVTNAIAKQTMSIIFI